MRFRETAFSNVSVGVLRIPIDGNPGTGVDPLAALVYGSTNSAGEVSRLQAMLTLGRRRRSEVSERVLATDEQAAGNERDINHADLFQELDTDNDGFISIEEAAAAAEEERPEDSFPDLIEQFDRLDTDGDGRLTLREFMEFEPRFHGVR